MSSVLERPVAPSADLPTSASPGVAGGKPGATGGKPRIIGVDVARGLALTGMMATHAFDPIGEDGDPTLVHMLAGGRAAATFVLLAGVSLAFLSGGRTAVRGRGRIGVSAGLAVRAVLIGAIGLALGYLAPFNGIAGILTFYGLFFLLAIPLLGCRAPVLLGIAAAAITLGPVLIVATADAGLPGADGAADPTFTTLVHDPLGLLVQLMLTGEYPAVVYLVLLCVGLVIGRLDLSSRRLSWWLFAGGVALAIAARVVSALLLYPMGGLARLIEQGDLDGPANVSKLLWDPELTTSWWYLALPAPHSHTPIDLLHTLGSAAAVLGAALLLTRVHAVARLLWPLAAAGSMSLTLYSAHLVVLATGVLDDEPLQLLLAMAVAGLVLATLWRRQFRQGPLEALVARPATATRRAAIGRAEGRATRPMPNRGRVSRTARSGAQFLTPLACAGALALMFFAGVGAATPAADGSDDVTDAPATSQLSDLSQADDQADDLADDLVDDQADVPDAEASGPVAEHPSDAEPVKAPSTTADEPGLPVLLLWIMCGIGAGLIVMMFLIARLSSASAAMTRGDDDA